MNVLIVDDELVVCQSCAKVIARRGHNVKYVVSGTEALKIITAEPFDIVFTDLKMPDMGGMEVIKFIKENRQDIVVIVITGFATIASAVETMKIGAFDYLPKPFTSAELTTVLEKAVEKRKLILANREMVASSELLSDYAGIIGKSPKMQEVYRLIDKVAPTSSTVLIIGGSGTGKELVASAIHYQSPRKDRRFIAVDCGTLSTNLLASDLFGYVKGAFTGASQDKKGLFETADGGTIFLDEIGNIDVQMQNKLLRVIQEQTFIPIGGTDAKKVDVRMIFATNCDLKEMVEDGRFREDLYYRLYVFPIMLPTLRERKEDIPKLAYHFLERFNAKNKRKIKKLSDKVLEILFNYEWPGNVRQLENTIERMAILTEGDEIDVRHLPPSVFHEGYVPDDGSIPESSEELKQAKKEIREHSVEFIERAFVVKALERSGWNVTRAAQEVDMQRSNFQALMRKYNVKSKLKDGEEE
jgi:DNA-binding NtrC family response regulator